MFHECGARNYGKCDWRIACNKLQTWEKEEGGKQFLKMKNLVGVIDESLEEKR